MAYDVHPYSYRNVKMPAQQVVDEKFELPPEPKRGDLEGYLAAKDFTSQAYSACMYSKAQANIRQLNNLRPDMTAKEYINILIKQGQVPEKHFKYQKTDENEIITELNSYRDIVKRVFFNPSDENTPVVSKYYNPDTGEIFKEVLYHSDGRVETKIVYADTEINRVRDTHHNATVPIDKTDNPFYKVYTT